MPIVKNVGISAIPAKHLADTAGLDAVRLAGAAVPGATSILLPARPQGIAVADIAPGASGEIRINGRGAARLAAGHAAVQGQKAVSAGLGEVKPAPLGYTGWGVGIFAESKSSSASPQDVLLDLAPKP